MGEAIKQGAAAATAEEGAAAVVVVDAQAVACPEDRMTIESRKDVTNRPIKDLCFPPTLLDDHHNLSKKRGENGLNLPLVAVVDGSSVKDPTRSKRRGFR